MSPHRLLCLRLQKYSHSELKDPQIMLLRTKKGVCIDVEVFVNCKFGYDINCEVVCEDGAIKMPSPIYPSIRKNAAVSTTIDTDCFVRFKDAYDTEVQDWVDAAAEGAINGPTAWDGYLGSHHSRCACKGTGNRRCGTDQRSSRKTGILQIRRLSGTLRPDAPKCVRHNKSNKNRKDGISL